MEESQNYGHQHPLLLLLNEDQPIVANCSWCGEKVSTPCFSCAQDCGFYLHKVCAEAPLELNHPFHPHHPLLLMQKAPYSLGMYLCNFCYEAVNEFFYHCSCHFNFHIKCALFTFNIAENNLKELEHVALQHPLTSTENGDYVAMCFGCWEPLANYTHFSPDCGFNLHEKCAKLPLKLNFMYHSQHPLVLQFNNARLRCKICKATSRRGFAYGCTYCELVFHIECLSPPLDLAVEDKSHQYTFTRLLRRVPYICDACGIEGIYVAYTCSTCSIMVHKRCTTLPRIIKSKWHDHRLFHKYFLPDEFRSSDCIICHDGVYPEHGSYFCSHCNITFHVRCVTQDKGSYSIVSLENEDEMPNESSIIVIERKDAGEATKIKHFKHMHNLMLGPFDGRYENSCIGCMLPITDPCYYCSECVFFLHKTCAELPKMMNVWYHYCQEPLALISDKPFSCEQCLEISNAFAYECCGCKRNICLLCVIALTPGARTSLKHKHPLFYYRWDDLEDEHSPIYYKHDWNQRPLIYFKCLDRKCNACGTATRGAFSCKDCNFVLDLRCFSLPIKARHKCDEHLLSLTDHDDNYSKRHHCDICENSRDPNRWFYHCATCDTSAHTGCVLGKYPFLKLGSIYEEIDHPHPLTIVKKKYYYPDCDKCGKLKSGKHDLIFALLLVVLVVVIIGTHHSLKSQMGWAPKVESNIGWQVGLKVGMG
ncbi:hypothetical protein PVK06_010054 [Gossypium arboreum]|uniref:Phorbol-ester/DAG-type domain-containing protein n=1 Tax=Gossypium arboreum TaxID=29729 RepID=A0ABR0QPK4_GOSAR|nr:hypothetical protein PVK06_010054 [Gossypium arboreum]